MENIESNQHKEVWLVTRDGDGSRFVSEDGETESFYSVEAGLSTLDKLIQTGKLSEANIKRLRKEIISSDLITPPTMKDVDNGHIELPGNTQMN